MLNDLILHNDDPFASQRAARIGQAVILLIVFVPQLSDLFATVRSAVFEFVFGNAGSGAYALLQLIGVM